MTDNRPLAWLQLVRLPAVFTALADILLGRLLVGGTLEPWPRTMALLAASAGLYLAGMVFNDVFDRDADASERPGRPIPSGRVTVAAASILGLVLIAGGLIAAGLAGRTSLLVAVLLAGLVLAYDGGLKRTPLGPLAMGGCRVLNVLLGGSTAGSLEELLQRPELLHVAIGLGLYITGVTWFARREAGSSSRPGLLGAMVVVNLGLATLVGYGGVIAKDAGLSVLLLLAVIVATINRRLATALADPSPARVQAGVRTMLLSVVMLDATLVLATTGQPAFALLVAGLLVPAVLLGRWIPVT